MQCLGKLDKSGIGMSKEGTVAMVAAKCLALTVSDLGQVDASKQISYLVTLSGQLDDAA